MPKLTLVTILGIGNLNTRGNVLTIPIDFMLLQTQYEFIHKE